ncbi:uncharacterized protein LOC6619249 isoform X1 [Drosophila sechellia]|uniref:uncharacterized protein LOC6619249 isoform X1 n=1 Tax=Drosophila sechellia TaxID=7238 RepID=UPI0013DDB1F5|nr:uncharacterized protein LOC6619249 isoform X1 [Drosophila sechellia]
MFLNDIGQPSILEKGKVYSSYEEHRGPLLFTSAALGELIAPQNWCQLAVGSQLDISRLQSYAVSESWTFEILLPNKPTRLVYDENKITITLIPAGRKENGLECNLFYIESGYSLSTEPLVSVGRTENTYLFADGHARYLIVDCLSEYLDFLPKASGFFHTGLRQGIDVMYVDEKLLVENQINEDLYSLADLIRPKFIYGLRQRELPKWLLDLRRIDDRNKKYSVLSVQNDAFKV